MYDLKWLSTEQYRINKPSVYTGVTVARVISTTGKMLSIANTHNMFVVSCYVDTEQSVTCAATAMVYFTEDLKPIKLLQNTRCYTSPKYLKRWAEAIVPVLQELYKQYPSYYMLTYK